MAVEEASLRIVILSISLGLTRLRKFPLPAILPETSNGTPSITINGSFDALRDAPPRIRMVLPSVGEPPPLVICTPLTLPLMSCSAELIKPPLKSLLVTLLTEPVRSLLRCVPYPITTTSLRTLASGVICTLTICEDGTATTVVLYPTKDICNSFVPLGTESEKFPSKSVIVPVFKPLAMTVTPIIASCCSSTTLPVTLMELVCAIAGENPPNKIKHTNMHHGCAVF